MGPRSLDRGNVSVEPNVPRRSHTSMGPRSLDRGNAGFGRAGGTLISRLQWGRDLSIAEMKRSWQFVHYTDASLQWGRDLSIAEIVNQGNGSVPNWSASMGPRSLDRGNCWDRSGQFRLRKASMGPRSLDRGNSVAPELLRESRVASMGPRSLDRGNLPQL